MISSREGTTSNSVVHEACVARRSFWQAKRETPKPRTFPGYHEKCQCTFAAVERTSAPLYTYKMIGAILQASTPNAASFFFGFMGAATALVFTCTPALGIRQAVLACFYPRIVASCVGSALRELFLCVYWFCQGCRSHRLFSLFFFLHQAWVPLMVLPRLVSEFAPWVLCVLMYVTRLGSLYCFSLVRWRRPTSTPPSRGFRSIDSF